MGGKELSVSTQEFFGFCRKGSFEKASQWINQKTKKSKLNFLRPTTPNVGWLANLRDPTTGYTVLHSAALNGHLEIVQLLVDQDQQLLTVKDRRGCLPLHLAAWNGYNQIVQYLLESEISTIDTVNNAKETPLHLAAQHGYGKVVAILLQKQANPRLRNARFENPLDIAARTGKENVCRLLICHCPELALQSAAECSRADNKTVSQHIVYPLHVAARHGHIECLRVFCESGFDVNYVTEEGTALHVAALFGQVEAVKLLLKYGVDSRIKDSQGKTVLEKLEEHETQKATDLTQIIQSREGWSECRKLIEQYIKGVKIEINGNQMESEDKEVVWRTLPENSLAVNNQNSNTSSQRISSTSSNGGIYYPPSMTVEHMIFDNDDENHASTITLSTNPQDLNTSFNESLGGENHSNSSSISPSAVSTSSHIKIIPKFPVTSPNAKTRHANTKRFGNPVTINGVEPKIVQLPSNNEPPCTYQPPPHYETWHRMQNKGTSYDNINLGASNGAMNHSYRNIPQPYDNAPFGNHRRWDHVCQNHGLEHNHQQPGFKNGTVGVNNGKNYSKPNQVIRDDGTQTIPAVKLTPSRPTILNGIFAQTIPEHPDKSGLPPSLPPKPRLKDSKSTEFNHPHKSTGVTFASSTLDRSSSPDKPKSKDLQGKAPLALPEELGGSTCTSLVSNSPERILNPIDERLRRSITTNSEDRTLVSMHEDYLPKYEQNRLDSTMDKSTPSGTPGNITSPRSVDKSLLSGASGNILSPESLDTIESSCSLPQISQLSSSSSTRPCSSEMLEKSDSSNVVVVLRDKHKPRPPSQTLTAAEIDQGEEWKKIEEILSAIRRDSFFAETNNSQVAVSVRNRKSQALTLQLSSVNPSSARYSNLSYPSEPEDLKNMPDRPPRGLKKKTENEVEEWLNLRVGLPLARSAEISTILNRNGFDQVKFIKGSLSRQAMTEMEIDKSIQHQISVFLQGETCQIPSIEDFEYASDWLSALQLIDYLEFFAMQDLTHVKKIIAANISAVDLKLMGINLMGHVERIQKSLNTRNQSNSSSLSTLPSSAKTSSTKTQSSSTLHHEETSEDKSDPENSARWEEKTTMLLHKCASYSAHYLGSAEISNVEGAEDCRRAMNLMKSRIRQISKVPQVMLEISVNGVNVLDSTNNRLTVQHEISKIQVVCQDELDLNCFAYIFQDGEKNFCHVYCVLTAEMARDIIMTLGHAFNLAYNLATGNAGQ